MDSLFAVFIVQVLFGVFLFLIIYHFLSLTGKLKQEIFDFKDACRGDKGDR
ncbi:MAG: hypothetical protein KatS3mg078_1882 [Deltaproteobacteria bacterium]|nr:MAG: hypothetical protein KatS3mg078_1882 [Deltaproteobacteria bacterium]